MRLRLSSESGDLAQPYGGSGGSCHIGWVSRVTLMTPRDEGTLEIAVLDD
jgi:hypothetical protein